MDRAKPEEVLTAIEEERCTEAHAVKHIPSQARVHDPYLVGIVGDVLEFDLVLRLDVATDRSAHVDGGWRL